jgi:hypothetical protein
MAKKHTARILFPLLSGRGAAPAWSGVGSLLALAVATPAAVVLPQPAAYAYVALMDGQKARPLKGQFNTVPVLHSNQPEEVEGPGILINTAPGSAWSTESGQQLRNAEYTFNGDFGIHVHHKYFPPYRAQITPGSRRSELTLALILINPGNRPVHLRFSTGAVRNSFEAPYLANSLMGVKPLGPRPWNTGPGDATAVQMLRGRLDSRLKDEVTIPARSRVVLFRSQLPALGIANGLLRGHSDGPFQMAVVAASNPQNDADLMAVLDRGTLAPGRVYLRRIGEIQNRQIFSRVGGVAIGDAYRGSLAHNLQVQGPLHVPLTSTHRHHFGTRDIQVNPLASRMLDSSLDNVGTYGVRFDIDLQLKGDGPHELVLSHPQAVGGKPFTAFRGSLQVETDAGVQEMHVGMRSGESLALTSLNLKPGVVNPVRVSLVYPADATPGHLLSVVPAMQLARLNERQRRMDLAREEATRAAKTRAAAAAKGKTPGAVPQLPPLPAAVPADTLAEVLGEGYQGMPTPPPLPLTPAVTMPPAVYPPSVGPVVMPPTRVSQSLIDRYQQALEAQQDIMRGLMTR